VGLGALLSLVVLRDDTSVVGAVAAFIAGLLAWGWLEASYLLGIVTGPRPRACPPGTDPARRFRLGILASLWHEITIVVCGVLLVSVHTGHANDVGLWTFLVLWAMRWSAKLNLFLGVARFNVALLPERLRYLTTFMAKRRINPLFPVSVTVGGGIAFFFLASAVAPGADDFVLMRGLLVGSLTLLGLLEHWLMVLPVDDSVLWAWTRRPATVTPLRADAQGSGRGTAERSALKVAAGS
jgi:putative photosynthetic complex assembly protein 2